MVFMRLPVGFARRDGHCLEKIIVKKKIHFQLRVGRCNPSAGSDPKLTSCRPFCAVSGKC